MSNWPLHDGARYEGFGKVTSGASNGTVVNASASANTKGAWTELIASTGFAYAGFQLFANTDTNNEDFLIDIAIGAAASEKIVADNIFSGTYRAHAAVMLQIPVGIPAGSRISARVQSNVGSATCVISGIGYAVGFASPLIGPHSRMISMGAATASTTGVDVNAGATANTKGAWSELVASTSADFASLVVSMGSNKNGVPAIALFLFDIGVGAAGSEKVIVPNFCITTRYVAFETVSTIFQSAQGPFPCSVPAGSRLAMRSQSTTNDATDRILDAVLYGIAA